MGNNVLKMRQTFAVFFLFLFSKMNEVDVSSHELRETLQQLEEFLQNRIEDEKEVQNADMQENKIESKRESKQMDSLLSSFFQQDLNFFHIVSIREILNCHIPVIIAQVGHMTATLEHTFPQEGDLPPIKRKIQYNLDIENVSIQPSPQTARDCNNYSLNYTCDIFADIVLKSTQHPTRVERIVIARLPLLTGYDPNALYDVSAAFIIRGKLRTCPSIKMEMYDDPTIIRSKDETMVQIRSLHHGQEYRSTSTLDIFIGPKSKKQRLNKMDKMDLISCRIPFVKTPINLSVLVAALGCSPRHFVKMVRRMADKLYKEEIFISYEVSFLLQRMTEEEALVALARLYSAKGELSTGRNQLNQEILPHLNQKNNPEKQRQYKLTYLAYCTAMLIASHEKLVEIPPRDSWCNSQIVIAAQHIASLFRLMFIPHIRQRGKQFRKALSDQKVHLKPDLESINISTLYGETALSNRCIQAVGSGEWSSKRPGVTNVMITSNEDVIQLQQRRISSALHKTDGPHSNARNVARDGWGFICPSYSPEGKEAGLVFELAMTATVTPPVPCGVTDAIMTLLQQHAGKWLVPIEEWVLQTCRKEEVGKREEEGGDWRFLINAESCISHVVTDAAQFVACFRKLRRRAVLSKFTFIADFAEKRRLQIYCRTGLLARPLFVASEFENFQRLQVVDFEEAVQRGFIEYVSPQEQFTLCSIVMKPEDLKTEWGKSATHIELLEASFLGLMAASIVFCTSQASPRLSLVTSQLKQVITALPPQPRGYVNSAQLWYAFRELAVTRVSYLRKYNPNENKQKNIMGRGTPCIVAVSPRGPQEDGALIRKSFIERAGLTCHTTNVYRSEAATRTNAFEEKFERPDDLLSRRTHSYSAITPCGLPQLRTPLKADSIVIGKRQTTTKLPFGGGTGGAATGGQHKNTLQSHRDISLSNTKSGVVVNSQLSQLPTGVMAIVEVQTRRDMDFADKCTTEQGQKFVAAEIVADEDCMFSLQTGIIPDMVMGPCGIVCRGTPSMSIEGQVAKAVALCGRFELGLDRQDFGASNALLMQDVGRVLKEAGLSPMGVERMVDGRTGKMIDCLIVTLCINILRLLHIADLKIYSRDTGPIDPEHRQPPSGRKKKGGGKSGEMENANFQAHGAATVAQERYCDLSDYFEVYVCKKCGLLVDDVGQDIDFAWCRRCASSTTTRLVSLPFTFHVLLHYFLALGIVTFLKINDGEEEGEEEE